MPERPGQPEDTPKFSAADHGDLANEAVLRQSIARLDELNIATGIREAEPAFANLARELAPDIPSRRWDVVVGDDGSGRLPARYVTGLINRWSHDHDAKPPQLLFVAGGQAVAHEDFNDYSTEEMYEVERAKQSTLSDAVALFANQDIKRVLYVTEFAQTGDSITRFHRAASHNGIAVDTVVFETALDENFARNRFKGLGEDDRVYLGRAKFYEHAGTFYGIESLREASGVKKIGQDPVAYKDPYVQQETINYARELIEAAAETMYAKFIKEQPADV